MPTTGSGQGVLTSRRRGGRACLMGCGGGPSVAAPSGLHHRGSSLPEPASNFGDYGRRCAPRTATNEIVVTNVMAWSERRGRLGEPSGSAYVALYREVIHDARERQLHDEDRTCGSDPRIPD